MHVVYFPKFCMTIVFDFSWDECNARRIWKQHNVSVSTQVHHFLVDNNAHCLPPKMCFFC